MIVSILGILFCIFGIYGTIYNSKNNGEKELVDYLKMKFKEIYKKYKTKNKSKIE